MKTKEQLQIAVDEIREVCRKHNIILVGTCGSEAMYSEITIGEASQEEIFWTDVAEVIDNTVSGHADSGFTVNGIGDLNSHTTPTSSDSLSGGMNWVTLSSGNNRNA